MDPYLKALNRDDVSQWLLHLCKPAPATGQVTFEVLKQILLQGYIQASTTGHITKFDPAGVVSFYDVPPQNWRELVDTNPNGREGYGIVFGKNMLWYFGARPAIYTDKPNDNWPQNERYRLINTDINKQPTPIDWTHEREWRVRGKFQFIRTDVTLNAAWWWPVVERIIDAQNLFREYTGINQIYIMELNRVLGRTELYV
ncbi:MAG: hypothetical protein AB2793_00170 [Candidatus Thiodiazotropha sp.]